MDKDLVTSEEACRLLGVKAATLYAYVSRGKIRTAPGPDARSRLYAREDLLRLRSGHDARTGNAALAATSLDWGAPVLDSALCEVTAQGPAYRGRYAVELARTGHAPEAVAEWLWGGELAPPSEAVRISAADARALVTLAGLPADASPVMAIRALAMAAWQRGWSAPGASADMERAAARKLVRVLAAAPALVRGKAAFVGAASGEGVSGVLLHALTGRAPPDAARRALDAALVVCADHELNASAFAARVAAGTGADLVACVMAALAAHSGPMHGAACDRVEAMLASIPRGTSAAAAIRARLARGEALPGFGHTLYPQGDPRSAPVLEAARAAARGKAAAVHALAVMDAAVTVVGAAPSVDFALVALCAALGLPPGSAQVVFAVGRSTGWVAHVLEHRQRGVMVRPRARYVGPPSAPAGA